jgi:hypothetical protein
MKVSKKDTQDAQQEATTSNANVLKVAEPAEKVPLTRNRVEDHSGQAPLFSGTLWKLNSNGDPLDKTHWLKRDMWVSSNGALCYFSIKDSKRLVLIDTAKLIEANVARYEQGCMKIAFEVKTRSDKDDDRDDIHIFACETEDDYMAWTRRLKGVSNMNEIRTMQLGKHLVEELRTFKLKVKNRRMKVQGESRDQFEPLFKGKLWKVKAEGNRMREEDWFEREMWIAKNGSLVYWSKKEERDLVYYTGDDVARATLNLVKDGESWRPWTFQVVLPPLDGMEFSPGEFAAESKDMLEAWFAEFAKWQRNTSNISVAAEAANPLTPASTRPSPNPSSVPNAPMPPELPEAPGAPSGGSISPSA